MERLTWISVLLLLGYISFCLAQSTHSKDPSVCKDSDITSSVPNKIRPNVTNMFNTWIECVIVNKNMTTDVHEYFDADHNRGFIEQIDSGLDYAALYSYNTNEFITWYPQLTDIPGTCKVTDMSKTDQRFLLGYGNINGMPHIYSANDALHLSGRNVNEVYMGVTTVRGIFVDWWRSCQYWRNMDATMIVDWYFTAKNSWDSSVGLQIPVTAHVKGKVHNDTAPPHNFDHYYNFFHFKPYSDEIHAKDFETPAGLQCAGRRVVKKFPKLPDDAFSFTTEVLDLNTNRLSYLKETFFYSQKLVKYEHRSSDGQTDLLEVHDFHSGLAYVTDINRGNCSVRAIERNDFDTRLVGASDVRIRNSKEFFYFDSSHVTYEGVKKNRKIACDSFVGQRSDYPFTNPVNSSWEWYFATNQWSEIAPGPELGAIPIQMRIKAPAMEWYQQLAGRPGESSGVTYFRLRAGKGKNYKQNKIGYNFQYNIYNFKKDKPDLLKFDISGCYELRNRTKFQILLPRSFKQVVQKNIDLARSAIQDSVAMYTGVKHIRVANIQVYFEYDIRVSFEILDVSPQLGDTQRSKDYVEIPLNIATNRLIQQIANGQFVVVLHGPVFPQPVNMVVENQIQVGYSMGNNAGYNSSLLLVTSLYLNTTGPPITKAGYGPGPMAAVGVTMPILGGGIGIAFAYFFFK